MEHSHFNRLPAELRTKIYETVFEDGNQEVVLNLTKWQTPKMQRPDMPTKNVTQPSSYTLTQTCKKIRSETLRLFYFTNTLVLDMADFEDHTSPIGIPPRAGTEKLRIWRDLVGGEAVRSTGTVKINLQYHYLGTGSKLELDPKAAVILRETFSSSTTLQFLIAIHLPLPEGMKTRQGDPFTGLNVNWTIGESTSDWEVQVYKEATAFWDEWAVLYANPAGDDRIKSIITAAAAESLVLAIDSMGAFWKPIFGPVLPPAMDAERETAERQEREDAWQEQRERCRRDFTGED